MALNTIQQKQQDLNSEVGDRSLHVRIEFLRWVGHNWRARYSYTGPSSLAWKAYSMAMLPFEV